jgi:hypothetical protein
VAISQAQADARWRSVRGTDLRAIFIDRELADGVHYAYQFLRDGTFTGFEMARAVRGTWRVTPGEFCWTWIKPVGREECFDVERAGSALRFLRDGNEYLSGELSPLNKRADRKESQ